jgi:TolB-like protein/AraC-like DNA-binding protein/Tfp pilus assembly protein PilF
MATLPAEEQEFLDILHTRIEENMRNESFGVTELAEAMYMSRSNLLRKVKKATNLSVAQLINQQRLNHAMNLLRTTSLNVSEVAHEVGFNSPSYFIKCFREYYGYPPGDLGKQTQEHPQPSPAIVNTKQNTFPWRLSGIVMILVVIAVGFWIWNQHKSTPTSTTEKSILVLPFKNESADSSNVYIINGLMSATHNNLQKIKNLKVISRTTAEKFSTTQKSISEMATELDVQYFIEGNGQKIGDRIVLNIQLIDGAIDRQVWSKQYRRQANDIFNLQQEIATDIAYEINAVISPEEKDRLEKVYTQSNVAYDAFLKGLVLLQQSGGDNLKQSLMHFDEAIQHDPTFSLAYACASMACYYLDLFHADKKYTTKLSEYADKAMLYDPSLSESLTAKGMHYLIHKEYSKALPYLEKALSYNPNSSQLLGLLADFYANNLPNTEKYLEYALKGSRLDHAGDSVARSYFYLRLGNALIQTGFIDESIQYLEKSLVLFQNNAYSRYVRAFALYARDKDLKETQRILQHEFNKDTTRFDILQDLGKVSYYLQEYDTAYAYYKRFNAYRDRHKLDVFQHENLNIGIVYKKVGLIEEGDAFIEKYRQYLDTDQTAYKHLGLAVYYCHLNESKKAIEHLRLFSQEDNIQYWIILFDQGPYRTPTESLPEFQKIMADIKSKFWRNHNKLKDKLEAEGLL